MRSRLCLVPQLIRLLHAIRLIESLISGIRAAGDCLAVELATERERAPHTAATSKRDQRLLLGRVNYSAEAAGQTGRDILERYRAHRDSLSQKLAGPVRVTSTAVFV